MSVSVAGQVEAYQFIKHAFGEPGIARTQAELVFHLQLQKASAGGLSDGEAQQWIEQASLQSNGLFQVDDSGLATFQLPNYESAEAKVAEWMTVFFPSVRTFIATDYLKMVLGKKLIYPPQQQAEKINAFLSMIEQDVRFVRYGQLFGLSKWTVLNDFAFESIRDGSILEGEMQQVKNAVSEKYEIPVERLVWMDKLDDRFIFDSGNVSLSAFIDMPDLNSMPVPLVIEEKILEQRERLIGLLEQADETGLPMMVLGQQSDLLVDRSDPRESLLMMAGLLKWLRSDPSVVALADGYWTIGNAHENSEEVASMEGLPYFEPIERSPLHVVLDATTMFTGEMVLQPNMVDAMDISFEDEEQVELHMHSPTGTTYAFTFEPASRTLGGMLMYLADAGFVDGSVELIVLPQPTPNHFLIESSELEGNSVPYIPNVNSMFETRSTGLGVFDETEELEAPFESWGATTTAEDTLSDEEDLQASIDEEIEQDEAEPSNDHAADPMFDSMIDPIINPFDVVNSFEAKDDVELDEVSISDFSSTDPFAEEVEEEEEEVQVASSASWKDAWAQYQATKSVEPEAVMHDEEVETEFEVVDADDDYIDASVALEESIDVPITFETIAGFRAYHFELIKHRADELHRQISQMNDQLYLDWIPSLSIKRDFHQLMDAVKTLQKMQDDMELISKLNDRWKEE